MYTIKSCQASSKRITQVVTWFLMATVILTTTAVHAKPSRPKPKNAHASNLNLPAPQSNNSTKKAITGSWIETVTFEGDVMPPLKSLVIYSSDGTITVADQGNVNVGAGQLFSAGIGSWVAQGDRTFAWTVVELISDLNGNLVGTLKVRGVHNVADSGNSYSGTFYAEVKDPSGNVLFSVEGSNTGQRIEVEPIP